MYFSLSLVNESICTSGMIGGGGGACGNWDGIFGGYNGYGLGGGLGCVLLKMMEPICMVKLPHANLSYNARRITLCMCIG